MICSPMLSEHRDIMMERLGEQREAADFGIARSDACVLPGNIQLARDGIVGVER